MKKFEARTAKFSVECRALRWGPPVVTLHIHPAAFTATTKQKPCQQKEKKEEKTAIDWELGRTKLFYQNSASTFWICQKI